MTDLTEQAAEVTETVLEAEYGGHQTPVARLIAQDLADAGLLRETAQEEVERLTRLIADTTALTGADAKTLVETVQELAEPARTVPTRGEIAEVLTYALTGAGVDDYREYSGEEGLRAYYRMADAVLELLADQPTVAEVQEQWANYITNTTGSVGNNLTLESLVKALRAPHPPFGGPHKNEDQK